MTKYRDLVSGIFWFSLGMTFSIWSLFYRVGSFLSPGPGLLPFILGILLIVFSLVLVVRGLKAYRSKKAISSSSVPGKWNQVVYTIFIMFFAAFSFEKIGYLLTVFLLIVFLMLWTEWRSIKKVLLTAFLSALGVHMVFVLLLKQPFPLGILRF
ncbi:MAG: tripartite tricarboxylate transporter TctB family protein [Thermodesulfobacteriota bacterium]